MRLGEISIDVALNRSSLNNAVEELRRNVKDINLQISPQVDHRPLTELNKHLDAKVKHVREINGYFALNPIRPEVDLRGLKDLEKVQSLIGGSASKSEIEILLRNDIHKLNIDKQTAALIGKLNQVSGFNRASHRQQTRIITSALKQVEKQIIKAKPNALLFGIQQGIGNQIASGINKQLKATFGFRVNGLGKMAVNAMNAPGNFLVRENVDFKNYLDEQKGKVSERLKSFFLDIGGTVTDALDLLQKPEEGGGNAAKNLIKTRIAEASKNIDQEKLKENAQKEFFNFGKQLFNPNLFAKVTQPFGAKLSNYREQTLSQRAIPLVRERAVEILKSNKLKNTGKVVDNDTEELFIATGGYAGARGLSGNRLAKSIRESAGENAKAIWVKNLDTDLSEDAVHGGDPMKLMQAQMISLGKPILRGYSKDALEIAAQGLVAKEQNPNITIKIVGESGGGFAAEEASKLLDMLGVKNDFIGVGTPNLIGGLDAKNRKILSVDEQVGKRKELLFKPLGLTAPDHSAQNLTGVFEHKYENYQQGKVAELQNFIQGSPGQINKDQLAALKAKGQKFTQFKRDGFDPADLAIIAQEAFADLQLVRRFLLEATEEEKAELEAIAKDFEAGVVEFSPEAASFGNFRNTIKDAKKKLEELRKTPGIESKHIADKLVKDLQKSKGELTSTFGGTVGTAKLKFEGILKELESIQDALNSPELEMKPVSMPVNMKVAEKVEIPIQNQQPMKPVSQKQQVMPSIPDPWKDEDNEQVKVIDDEQLDKAEKAVNRAKKIAATFSNSYKDIQKIIKTEFGSAIQKTTNILENTQRAKSEIKALRNELGKSGEMGTPAGNVINQSLGNISKVELNLKRAFAKIKSPKSEVQKLAHDTTQGIIKAIDGNLQPLQETAKKIPQTIISATKEDLQIKSPSRVFFRIGEQVIEGFKGGLKGVKQKGLFNFLKDSIGDFVNVASSLVVAQKSFEFLIDLAPALKNTALEFERISIGLLNVSGSAFAASEKFAELKKQANFLGQGTLESARAYMQFSAATKETAIESSTDLIFKNLQEGYTVRQLNQEQIAGANLAIEQIASKGQVQQEELRGQLGERIAGTMQIAARSRGQSVAELNKDISKGLSSEDFLPGFARQLATESALALPKALDSSVAVTNRFNNAVTELQATLGKPILEIEKTGLKLFTPVLENLNVILPLAANFIGYLAATTLIKFLPVIKSATIAIFEMVTGMGLSVTTLKSLATTISKTALNFVAFTAVVEIFKAISVAIKDSAGDLKDFAEVSANGLKVYRDSLKDINKEEITPEYKDAPRARSFIDKALNKIAPDIFKNQTSVLIDQQGNQKLKESAIGQGLAGFLPDTLEKDANLLTRLGFGLRESIQNMEGVFGDYSEKAKNDRVKALTELKKASTETNNEVAKLVNSDNSPLVEAQNIDKRLQALQLKRRAVTLTNPEDINTLKAIKAEEEELLKKREGSAKSIALLQTQNATTIEAIKKAITEAERLAMIPSNYQKDYREQADKLKDSLKLAEDAQEKLNRAIKKGIDAFSLFVDRANDVMDVLADNREKSVFSGNSFKQIVNQAQTTGQYTPEQAASINQQIDIQATVNELTLVTRSIRELSQLIAERGEVLNSYGVQPSTGVNQLQRLTEQIENPNDKVVIEKFIELKNLQKQASELTNQVSQQQTAFAQTLRDTAKEVADFYKELANQSAQLIQETKQIQNTIALNSAKGKLKSALLNQQESFVNGYVEGLIGVIESLNQPLQQALQAQSQMLGNYQGAVGQQTNLLGIQNRQAVLLNNQLPFQNQNNGINETGFTNSGGIPGSRGVIKPIAGNAPITSNYGMRNHPVTGGRKMHYGIDYGVPAGTPVLAPTAGKVTFVDDMGSGGKTVKMQSIDSTGRKIEQMFLHLSSYAVKVGDIVKQGQKLGGVGTTGLSTGNHLDYRLTINGKYVNPNEFLKSNVIIPGTGSGGNAQTSTPRKQPLTRDSILWGQAGNYNPSDLSGLTARGQKAKDALKNANVRAFLDAVAIAELGDGAAAKGGYGYLFGDTNGKESFNPNNLNSHPNKRVSKWGHTSSATGRYQTMDFVWKEEAPRLGLKDMKPQSQEIMAVSRLMYRGILDEVMKGNVRGVIKRSGNMDASSEWASLQGNPYGQGTKGGKLTTFLNNFEDAKQKNVPTSQDRKLSEQRERARTTFTNPRNVIGQNETGFTPVDLSGLNLNQAEIEKANQLIIDNYQTQNNNIKQQLKSANQLQALETQLQKQNVNSQFKKSLTDVEENVLNTQRRISDLGTKEAVTPQERKQQEVLSVNREFLDLNKGLIKQRTELESAFNTLQATKNVIETGGFQGAEQLQSELPSINDGLIRLKKAIEITETGFTSSEKARLSKLAEIDAKYAKATQDTARQVSNEQRKNQIQAMRKEADIIESSLGGNIGGQARGDVLSLRKNASELEILLGLDEQIQQLYELQKAGERTEEQTKALKAQFESLASKDLELNNLKYQTELRQKLLQIEERELAISQKKTGFEKNIAETLASNADFRLNLDPSDLSSGDPIILRYQANLVALEDEFKQLNLEAKRFAETQNLSAEETSRLLEEIRLLNELKEDNLTTEYKINLERAKQERAFRIEEQRQAISGRFSQLDFEQTDINSRKSELFLQKNPFNFSEGNPIDIKFNSSIISTKDNLAKLKLETRQFAYAQNLTSQETELLIQQLESLNVQQLELLQTEHELNKEQQARDILANERSKNEFKNNNFTNLLGAGAETLNLFGLTTEAGKLQKQISEIQLKDEFANNLVQLEEFARTSGLSSDEINHLRENLEKLNEIKLDNLQKQFNPWTEVMRSGVEGLQNGISGLIQGTMSLGDAFNTIGLSIANTLTKLASEFVTNEIISGIFGKKQLTPNVGGFFDSAFQGGDGNLGGFVGSALGLLGGGGSGGGGGIIKSIGSILGFSTGGTVPETGFTNIDRLNNETGFTKISEAMRKEGSNSVLATLTPGEEVLNLSEAKLYRKLFPQGLSKIYSYKEGGTVGDFTPNKNIFKSETGFNINVPVTVNGGNSNINPNELSYAIKAAVVGEIKKQQNPGGLLNQ